MPIKEEGVRVSVRIAKARIEAIRKVTTHLGFDNDTARVAWVITMGLQALVGTGAVNRSAEVLEAIMIAAQAEKAAEAEAEKKRIQGAPLEPSLGEQRRMGVS